MIYRILCRYATYFCSKAFLLAARKNEVNRERERRCRSVGRPVVCAGSSGRARPIPPARPRSRDTFLHSARAARTRRPRPVGENHRARRHTCPTGVWNVSTTRGARRVRVGVQSVRPAGAAQSVVRVVSSSPPVYDCNNIVIISMTHWHCQYDRGALQALREYRALLSQCRVGRRVVGGISRCLENFTRYCCSVFLEWSRGISLFFTRRCYTRAPRENFNRLT